MNLCVLEARKWQKGPAEKASARTMNPGPIGVGFLFVMLPWLGCDRSPVSICEIKDIVEAIDVHEVVAASPADESIETALASQRVIAFTAIARWLGSL